MHGERVLVVGCGGIGCELLKLLSREEIGSITLIDSDTIEFSNLNRQFLFGREDVGKEKAVVAGNVFEKISQGCKATVIFGDVLGFDAEFFASYDIVFGCLDNDETRTYVNQRCFIGGTTLVDGGSRGFRGQAYFFDYKNECFDCIPKKATKEHLVCTIRSRPTKFEHCIAWAKEIFIGMDLPVVRSTRRYYNQNLRGVIENCDDMSDATGLQRLRESHGYKRRALLISRQIKEKRIDVFDKDSRECIDFLYNVAWMRASCAGVEPYSYDDTLTIAVNIVPAVSTANAIVASLMINSRKRKCCYYLTEGRKIVTRADACSRNPACPTCSRDWLKVYSNGWFKACDLFSSLRALGYRPQAYSDEQNYLSDDLPIEIAARDNSIGEIICSGGDEGVFTVNLYFVVGKFPFSVKRRQS
jgi:ubiquitin-like 1-activating enzyme E1 B